MRRSLIESLESRQLLAADLGVSITSTTLPDSLVVGAKSKPSQAVIAVNNAGDAIVKSTKGNVTVTVGLKDASDVITPLGTKTVKASALAKTGSAAAKVKLIAPDSLAEGNYTLVASVDGGEVVVEDNTANNAADGKSVAVETANGDLLVTGVTSFSTTAAAGDEGTITVSVQNLGNVQAKGTGVLEVTSTINGTPTVIATVEKVKLNVKVGATVNLKPIKITVAGTAGVNADATIGATLTTTVLNDDVGNNAAVAGLVTVTPPPPSPFDASNLGSEIAFKTTQSGGNSIAGFETGNWTDSNGRTGTYYITRGVASNGLCTLQSGVPVATLVFSFNDGSMKLGGKSLLFGVDQSAATGSVQYAGGTVYFKKA